MAKYTEEIKLVNPASSLLGHRIYILHSVAVIVPYMLVSLASIFIR